MEVWTDRMDISQLSHNNNNLKFNLKIIYKENQDSIPNTDRTYSKKEDFKFFFKYINKYYEIKMYVWRNEEWILDKHSINGEFVFEELEFMFLRNIVL